MDWSWRAGKAFSAESLPSKLLVMHHVSESEHVGEAWVTLAAEKTGAPERDEEGGVRIHTVLAVG